MTPVTGKVEAPPPVAGTDDPELEPVAPRRGRPRATDRTPTILRTVIELVDEAGYDHLRIQDVADRAGVGLATIYRRWPTKQALFIEALRAKSVDLPDTGDVRADLLAIFERMAEGLTLEDSMRQSLEELDGVFTYMCVTADALGVCKDEMAAKPLVLYEGDDMVAMASEEMAIRAIIDHEIETYDPYESEVLVWTR